MKEWCLASAVVGEQLCVAGLEFFCGHDALYGFFELLERGAQDFGDETAAEFSEVSGARLIIECVHMCVAMNDGVDENKKC